MAFQVLNKYALILIDAIVMRPCDSYRLQYIESSLIQVMAHHLFGAKPLPEPTLTYSQMDP